MQLYSTGRRKTSSARIFLNSNGNGKIYINKKIFTEYFFIKKLQLVVLKPFKVLNIDLLFKLNLYITVKGGGISGQAFAICHGISRVLLKYNIDFRKDLKIFGLITRDSRKVERKKFGLKKSRRRPQFSKR